MSEKANIQKIKFNSLINAFENLGYKYSNKIGPKELILFLDKKASSGHFDDLLSDKLLKFLNIGEKTTITVDKFIEGYLIFEDEIAKNADSFRIKFAKEKEIYNKILKQCELYKSEKLNEEGFCKNAKIYGQVTDIDIKKKLEGIKEIIIEVLFNNKKEELHFKIGSENTNIKKSFEFRPTSRKDHFEFVMKGINYRGKEFTIGSKIFPLDEISSQEEYLVQIIIPEIEDPNKVAAYIKATIVLYMSDFKYYEDLRKKQEKILKIFKNAVDKSYQYLKNVREIYGDLKLMNRDITVDFNNEKLFQRRGTQLSVNIENKMEPETRRTNYYVEYNNEREIQKLGIPLQVEFNNLKKNYKHSVETKKKVEYSYKNNYNNLQQTNITKKVDDLIQEIEKEKIEENKVNEASKKLPPKIERKVEQEVNQNSETIQKLSNEQIIAEQNKSSHQSESQSDLEKILLKQNEEDKIHQDILKQPNEDIIKDINSSQNNQQDQNKFDIDAFINQKYNINNSQNYLPSQKDISNIQQNKVKEYNIGNLPNTAMVKNITTTKIQNLYQTQPNINNNIYNTNLNTKIIGENNQYNNIQGDNSTELGRASIYQIVGNISKKDTMTSQPQTLEPIIKKPDYNISVNKAIMHEKTNKILISENTLPVSYLPEKINKLIVSDVTYLPLATTEKKVTYNTVNPIIHEPNVFVNKGNENIVSNVNNNNLNLGQNLGWNNVVNNSQSINNNYNYSYNIPSNINNNSTNDYAYLNYNNYNINGNSNYNYNLKANNNRNNNIWNTTTKTTKLITNSIYPQRNSNNFQMQTQGHPVYLTQQIKY